MQRITTFVPNGIIYASDHNAIQDSAAGIIQLSGHMIGPAYVSNVGGSSSLLVGPIASLLLATNTDLSTSAETTVTLSGLTTNTWYYLYAYNNAGVIGFEYSTVAPAANLTFKSSDTSRRYLCAFRSKTSSTCFPFRKNAYGHYVYRKSSAAVGDLQALTGGTAGPFTDVALGVWVPPHARIARVFGSMFIDSSQTTDNVASFRTNGDTTDAYKITAERSASSTGDDRKEVVFEIEADGTSGDSGRIIEYSTNSGGVDLFVYGWSE